MTRRLPLVLAAALALGPAAPASAQLIVHDPRSYASLIREAQTALDQLTELKAQVAEAKRLYDGFNTGSGAGRLAAALDAPALRRVVPDLDRYLAAADGDFSGMGGLGGSAARLRATERLFSASRDEPLGRELERRGDRAARDAAVGQAVAKAGADRLSGLEDLLAALDAAPNARAVMDLQARLAAEQALTANDQLRLQGLAMAQAGEARLEAQRDRERAAAAAQARLALYRRGFR